MLPRGIRNNNPFNMVKSLSNWIGKIQPSKDSAFEQFDTMENGVRAGLINLRNAYYKKGLKSVEAIITKYCPPNGSGNSVSDTNAYINAVSLGVFNVAGAWKLDTTGNELNVAYEIMKHENGFSPVTKATIKQINTKYKIFE